MPNLKFGIVRLKFSCDFAHKVEKYSKIFVAVLTLQPYQYIIEDDSYSKEVLKHERL